jgi:hypothetical protein
MQQIDRRININHYGGYFYKADLYNTVYKFHEDKTEEELNEEVKQIEEENKNDVS